MSICSCLNLCWSVCPAITGMEDSFMWVPALMLFPARSYIMDVALTPPPKKKKRKKMWLEHGFSWLIQQFICQSVEVNQKWIYLAGNRFYRNFFRNKNKWQCLVTPSAWNIKLWQKTLNEPGNSSFMRLHWKCLVKLVKHRRWGNYLECTYNAIHIIMSYVIYLELGSWSYVRV